MTNKKLWLSLLAIVLIVCMISVTLVSCKKKDKEEEEEPEEEISIEEQALTAIVQGIQKSVAAGDMTDLRLDGTIGLTVNDKAYDVALALDLDLLQFEGYTYSKATSFSADEKYFTKVDGEDDEYEEASGLTEFKSGVTYYTRSKKSVEKNTYSNTALTAEIREGKNVLLGAYYADSQSALSGTDDAFEGGSLYVQCKTDDGQKYIKFPAPYVAATMKAFGASVDFHNIDLDDDDTWSGAESILAVVAGIAEDGHYTEGQSADVTINLESVLNSFSSILKGTQGYFNALGLDIDASALASILPAISIKISATFDSTGMVTGADLSLVIKEKDIEIKNKQTPQGTFLMIDMDGDVNIGLSLDYTIYGTDEDPNFFYPTNLKSYKAQDNIVDINLSVDLDLSKPIEYGLTLNGNALNIKVEEGYYTLSIKAAINPFALLQYLKNDATKKIDFSSTPKIISSIDLILEALSGAEIRLDKFAATVDRDKYHKDDDATQIQKTPLRLVIADSYSNLGNGYYQKGTAKMANISTTILSKGNDAINPGNIEISGVIDLVKGFIEKQGEANFGAPVSADEESDAKIMNILTTVGTYLAGAYIGINDGTHGVIYASFDSSKTTYEVIPFSGYTKWTGEIKGTESFNFYTVKTASEVKKATSYEAGKTYYVWGDNEWEKVDNSTVDNFDDLRYYYTKSGDTYTEASVTKANFTTAGDLYICKKAAGYREVSIDKFETGVTYYYYTVYNEAMTAAQAKKAYDDAAEGSKPTFYVKGLSDKGGDFGIGLSATLDISKENGLVIDATVTNLNIFGLPATLTAKISGLEASIWDNDYPIFIGENIDSYQTVNGKVQKSA